LAQNIKKLTENGLLDALNGRWPSANSSLEKAATLSRNKLIPKLFCALGALLEGNATNRDLALSTVDIRNKQEQTSFQLAKAQILMASQDWEKAFSCLKIQYEKTPSHPYAIFLLAQTCCQLQEWALLSQLLPNLKRNKAVKETQYKRWQEECFHYRLKLASRQSTNELMDTWKRADRDEKSRLLVKKTYIEGLIGLNEFEKAKSELAYLLKKQWDALLCYCYLKFPADQIDGLLTAVDSLCQEHPHEIICQKTLGILCYQSRRYVRAKEILSSAVLQHPCRESLEFLAYAHAAEGEWEQSIVFLKQALSL
jgi:HemY protein